MANLTSSQQEFIDKIVHAINKYRDKYNIKVVSPILAQAIVESNWGESKLSREYHNYFGMKSGTKWKGKSVDLNTREEYTVGELTPKKNLFRAYNSLDEGVEGYFIFINTKRYDNLKGLKDYRRYVENLKQDGYATSSKYINTLLDTIDRLNLTKYDPIDAKQPYQKQIVYPHNPDYKSLPSTTDPNKALVGKKTYVVQKGDSLSKIAMKLKLSWMILAKLNKIESPYTIKEGQIIVLPDDYVPEIYVVQKGDSLSKIASTYGLRWTDIARLNNILSPYTLRVGQLIKLK